MQNPILMDCHKSSFAVVVVVVVGEDDEEKGTSEQ
jgi:hypothetical protein